MAEQLCRIALLEHRSRAFLTVAEANTILAHLPDADDDLLAAYALRSSLLDLSIAKLESRPSFAESLPRLRFLTDTVVLHEPWRGPRISGIDHLTCRATQPLAAWINQHLRSAGRDERSLENPTPLSFAIVDDASSESARSVVHPAFGRGRVVSQAGEIATVRFDDGSERRIKIVFLHTDT